MAAYARHQRRDLAEKRLGIDRILKTVGEVDAVLLS
jgi:hypothetical protein